MQITILDCYTDEPSGLGVAPYLVTYPRYIAGACYKMGIEPKYLTIDDIRAYVAGKKPTPEFFEKEITTPIKIRNISPNFWEIESVLKNTDLLIVVAGVHTPGKYLSAYPGTTKEVADILRQIGFSKKSVLTGPSAQLGSGLFGGKKARGLEQDYALFTHVIPEVELHLENLLRSQFSEQTLTQIKQSAGAYNWSIMQELAVRGAPIVKQHPCYPDFMIVELETMRGCAKKVGCSFCTEPLKSAVMRRPSAHIIEEVKALAKEGIVNFRIGKQTCFYSYSDAPTMEHMLKEIRPYCKILLLDNCNPAFVTEEKTKIIVKYMTEGNIAAFGAETFDIDLVRANFLNTTPDRTIDTIRLLNKYGSERGPNGLPAFLPGINIIFGLLGETRQTHQRNMEYLQKIVDEGLMLRRINIRQVVLFPGTLMGEKGGKELRKYKKYYWKWRKEIREKIDFPLLKRLVPTGTILRDLRTEVYQGNVTFARQVGTYPLTVGIKGRVGLDKFINVKVTDHMLRSVTGEIVTDV